MGRLIRPSLVMAFALVLAACGGDDPTPGNGGNGGGGNGGGDGGAAKSVLSLTLTGGADAGTYAATSADPTCSYGLTGEDSWGNQYSDADLTEGFSSLQLIVPSTEAAASGTDEFLVTVTIGPLFEGNTYEINTQQGATEGSGTVTVNDSGDTARVIIEGETADGVGIRAEIVCNEVFRITA